MSLKLRPSSSNRWLACPGSVSLCAGMPKKDTAYNMEGSAAHDLAEQCLKENRDPAGFKDEIIWVKETHAEKVTDNMIAAVEEYVNYVRDLPGDMVMIEEKMDLGSIIDSELSSGKADYIKYDSTTKILNVVDYKHGVGTLVSPEENSQMMLYALAAAKAVHQKFDGEAKKIDPKTLITTIRIIVVQPRTFGDETIKIWETSFKHVFDWCFKVVRDAIHKIKNGDTTLRIGDHCKFCDAKPRCPKMLETAKSVTNSDLVTVSGPVLEPAETIGVDKIAKILPYTQYIKDWLKSIEEHALLLADTGTKFEGYKLIRGKSNRRWLDTGDAERAIKDYIGDKVYAERKILSVAQAEKALKRAGESAEAVLADLWEKPIGALKLVSINEKGKEVEASVVEDFTDQLPSKLDPSFWE